jgi:hypothetical protein
MFLDRHKISLGEITFDEYCEIKRTQELKCLSKPEAGAIYGVILEGVSASVGSFARGIDQNLDMFRKINRLIVTKEKTGTVFQKRKKIYSSSTEDAKEEKLYYNSSNLERMIKEGRGIDLIFKGQTTNPEKHFYRLMGNNVVLVEIHIPYRVLAQGLYQLKRLTGEDYSKLKATSMMPKQEIILQELQRRTV